jgi:predicted RNA-binding Zn ribbon-like protein
MPRPNLRDLPVACANMVGGVLCLDFANTTYAWRGPAAKGGYEPIDDRLVTYADLLAWSVRVGVLDRATAAALLRSSERQPDRAAAALTRARRLRAATYGIGRSLARSRAPSPTDLEALEREVRRLRRRERLSAGPGGLRWTAATDTSALDSPLDAVIRSADQYFTRGDVSRLRVCPGDPCGWLFADTSRNGSRQWCDMRVCGNLAKVRRFRARRGR